LYSIVPDTEAAPWTAGPTHAPLYLNTSLDPKMALPAFVWVEIEAAAAEVDGRLEVLGVVEASGRLLRPPNDGSDAFEAGVGEASKRSRRSLST